MLTREDITAESIVDYAARNNITFQGWTYYQGEDDKAMCVAALIFSMYMGEDAVLYGTRNFEKNPDRRVPFTPDEMYHLEAGFEGWNGPTYNGDDPMYLMGRRVAELAGY